MTSCGADGKTYEMAMAKDSPNFAVKAKRLLLPFEGTDLMIYMGISFFHSFLCGALQLNLKTHPSKGHNLYSYRRLDWDEGCPFEQAPPVLFELLPC